MAEAGVAQGPGAWRGVAAAMLAMLAVVALTALVVGGATLLGMDVPLGNAGETVPARAFVIVGAITAGAFVVVSFAVLTVLRSRPPIGIERSAIGPSIVALVAVWVVNSAGAEVMHYFGEFYSGLPRLTEHDSWAAFVIVAVILAPVAEEVFFREVLLIRLLGGAPRPVAVAFTSVAFGLMHLEAGGVVLVATLTLMGVVFALLRYRTGSIGPPILVHGLNNLLAVLVA